MTHKLLISGGESGYAFPSTVIYNAETFCFQIGPDMSVARRSHSSVSVSSGKVFLSGGIGEKHQRLSSCETFDPATGIFEKVGHIGRAVQSHASVAMPKNRVLLTGGHDDAEVFQTAGLFDLGTNTFAPCSGGMMIERRCYHTASRIPGKRALICGGFCSKALQTTEIYDSASDSFSRGPDMIERRLGHAATTLLDGTVLVTGGGRGETTLRSTELYDPKTNTFTAGPDMLKVRVDHSSSLLPDGSVLIIGDKNGTTTEIYDPVAQSFSWGPSMNSMRYYHSAASFVQ